MDDAKANVVLAGHRPQGLGAGSAHTTAKVADYAAQLSTLNVVTRVDSLAGSFAGGAKIVDPGPLNERFAVREGTRLVCQRPDRL